MTESFTPAEIPLWEEGTNSQWVHWKADLLS